MTEQVSNESSNEQIEIHYEDKELVEDYISGMNYKKILEKHELAHLDELYLILSEYKIPFRRNHNSATARYEKIYNLYLKGYKTQEIMSLAGVTKHQVYNALHRYGVGDLKASEKERQEKIYNLYNEGKSVKEISDIFNVHKVTVYRTLTKFGVDVRHK